MADPAPDPVDELRQLYERLAPPELADDLSQSDAETARVVGWMRAAWCELASPRAVVPVLRALRARDAERRARRHARSASRQLLAAAAAAGLLFCCAALWRAFARGERGEAVSQAPGAEAGAESRVEILDVAPDRVELRSGPVRLVLLGSPDDSRSENPPGG